MKTKENVIFSATNKKYTASDLACDMTCHLEAKDEFT